MGFTYDLSTDVGKLRLRVGDTAGVAPGGSATSGYAFDDDELAQFLTDAGSVGAAAVRALDTLIVSKARRARKFEVPGLTYDDTAALAELRAIRQLIAADESSLPTLTVSTISGNASGDPYLTPYLPR